MRENYNKVLEFVREVEMLCEPNKYNLVLHKHLGDIFYAIACKDVFEKTYKKALRFIIRPQHEFLMEMFRIDDYSLYDLDVFVKKNSNLKDEYFREINPQSNEIDRFENEIFQALFSCIPCLDKPFIAESLINDFLSYDRYWCHRWPKNMGLIDDFKFNIPKNNFTITENVEQFSKSICPLEKLVLFAPEAATAIELPPEIWDSISEIIHSHGYTILVNSKRLKIKYGLNAFDYNLSLKDIISIGLNCKYVFSLRSGLCDVLVSKGSNLYVIYPAMLRREYKSLSIPFLSNTYINEIQMYNWSISLFQWEGVSISNVLQPIINRIHRNYIKESVKRKISNNKVYDILKNRLRDIAGKSKAFPDNNAENKLPSSREYGLSFISFYKREKENLENHKIILNGLFSVLKSQSDYKISILGIPILKVKNRQYRKISIFGIPVYIKNRTSDFFQYITEKIKGNYDSVFICRHNIGETIIYLSYFDAWVSKNELKHPLVLVWRLNDMPLYKMFLGEKYNILYIPISQSDINLFLRKSEYFFNDLKIYSPTYNIAKNLKSSFLKEEKINFISYILKDFGISSFAKVTNNIKLPNILFDKVENILDIHIKSKRFILICPESKSIRSLSLDFWNNLISKLNKKGYFVIVNTFLNKENKFNAQYSISCPLDELCIFAKFSVGVISMASGLGVLLASLKVKCDLIYTNYNDEKNGFNSSMTKEIYSVQYLKTECGIDTSLSREWDILNINKDNLIDSICSRY